MGQFVTFVLDDARFGIDVFYTREINDRTGFTPVPGARPFVAGVMNLRGEIVTMIDLRLRLGLPARAAGAASINLVLKTQDEVAALDVGAAQRLAVGNERMGFVIDTVGDIVTVADDAIEPLPAVDEDRYDLAFIRGVVPGAGDLWMVLDVERLVNHGFRAEARRGTGSVPT
ncbi:MAG: chemotaxis protein CheW [Planctomycetota bacterium]